MSKIIFIVDPLSDGHHTLFVTHIAGALISNGYVVSSFHPNDDEVKKWLKDNNYPFGKFHSLYKDTGALFTEKKRNRFEYVINQIKKWFDLRNVIKKAKKRGIKIDLVFFLYVDTYYVPVIRQWMIDLIFPYKWVSLCLRPPHENSSRIREIFLNTFSIFSSKRCKAIGVLEEELVFNSSCKLNFKKKFLLFPDFTDTELCKDNYSLVEEIKTKACGRRIIGTLGSLSKRKGMLKLLNTAEEMKNEPCLFVFVGQMYEDSFTQKENAFISEFVSKSPENCYFDFSFIPDEPHFNMLVSICDVLTILYENFPYSSNLFSKAAEFQKLVIGSDSGCIGNRIQKYNFGIPVNTDSIISVKCALKYLLVNYNQLLKDARFEDYLTMHSRKNIDIAIESMLQRVNL